MATRAYSSEHADEVAKLNETQKDTMMPKETSLDILNQLNTTTIELDTPIVRGDNNIIDTLTIKKPDAGQLRGVKLMDLIQMDIDAIIKVAPRVATPTLTENDVANLDPVDLLAVSTAVVGFFQTKAERAKQN